VLMVALTSNSAPTCPSEGDNVIDVAASAFGKNEMTATIETRTRNKKPKALIFLNGSFVKRFPSYHTSKSVNTSKTGSILNFTLCRVFLFFVIVFKPVWFVLCHWHF